MNPEKYQPVPEEEENSNERPDASGHWAEGKYRDAERQVDKDLSDEERRIQREPDNPESEKGIDLK